MSRIEAARWAVVIAILVLLAGGCSSTSATTPEAAPPESAMPPESAGAPGVSISATTEPASDVLVPIYFETNSAVLRDEAHRALALHATAIRENADWGAITIEGHCDERGSAAYNQALGQRRAAAVKHHLLELGVPDSRVEIQSFGDSSPAVSGHGESSWRYNRRSEFRVAALH